MALCIDSISHSTGHPNTMARHCRQHWPSYYTCHSLDALLTLPLAIPLYCSFVIGSTGHPAGHHTHTCHSSEAAGIGHTTGYPTNLASKGSTGHFIGNPTTLDSALTIPLAISLQWPFAKGSTCQSPEYPTTTAIH